MDGCPTLPLPIQTQTLGCPILRAFVKGGMQTARTAMPFPELMDRLFRLFNIKNSDEPTIPIPQDRLLTSQERTLIEWLLVHAEPNASEFLPQLEAARVCWKCSCGCPHDQHRDFSVDSFCARPNKSPIRPHWRSRWKTCGGYAYPSRWSAVWTRDLRFRRYPRTIRFARPIHSLSA